MQIQCRSFIDADNARVASLEISQPVPRDIVENIDATKIRGEVTEAVRAGLLNAQIPDHLAEQLRSWRDLVGDLDSRSATGKTELAEIAARRAELWKGGAPTSATLMALDDAEAKLREQLQAVKNHLNTVRDKKEITMAAVRAHLRQEGRKIAQAEVALTQAETKALEGLESFLMKNQALLMGACRKKVAQYLYGDRSGSWLGSLEPLADLRAISLLAEPLEVVANVS